MTSTDPASHSATAGEHPNARLMREIPFDQAENDRYLAVQAASLARAFR